MRIFIAAISFFLFVIPSVAQSGAQDSCKMTPRSSYKGCDGGNFIEIGRLFNTACFFYFKFIQSNKDAALSEAISIESYEMWKNHRAKAKNLLDLANNLPAANRNMILSSIVQAMCLDLNANNYNLQLFKKDFPLLSDTVAVEGAKKCFDDWIE